MQNLPVLIMYHLPIWVGSGITLDVFVCLAESQTPYLPKVLVCTLDILCLNSCHKVKYNFWKTWYLSFVDYMHTQKPWSPWTS